MPFPIEVPKIDSNVESFRKSASKNVISSNIVYTLLSIEENKLSNNEFIV